MKKRLLISSLLQIGLTVLSLLAAHNLDLLASGHGPTLSLNLGDAVTALSNRRVFLLFLLLTGLSAVSVFCMAFGRSYINYRSDMRRLTPEIETPMAAGQDQYGTAKWLEQRCLPQAFTVVEVDMNSPMLRQLIEEAEEDQSKEGVY